MVQIDLDSRYEQYLKEQVEAGLFSSVNAAAAHAIDAQMAAQQRASCIKKALAKGEQDIAEGKTVPFTADMISEISKKGKKMALAEKLVNCRSAPKQIEHWAGIGRIVEENPDLPYSFIKDILLSRAEMKDNATTPYQFG